MQYLMALVPALCWGSVGLVSGKLGGSVKQQTLGMVFGATLFAIVFTLFNINAFLASCSLMLWILGILSGFLWTVGQTFQFSAMKKLGISKAYPLSTGAQLIGNCIFGVLVFHEWKTGEQTAMGLCALAILVLGTTFTAFREKRLSDGSLSPEEKGDSKAASVSGAIALSLSTLGYCGNTVVITASGLDAKGLMFPQALGWLLGGAVFALRKSSFSKETFKNMLTGLSFGVGSLFLILSIANLGLAISFSLSQAGAIISTLGPVLLLGEKKTKKELVFSMAGCVLIMIGGVLLGRIKY